MLDLCPDKGLESLWRFEDIQSGMYPTLNDHRLGLVMRDTVLIRFILLFG